MDESETSSIMNSTQRKFRSKRANSVLKPLSMFDGKQNAVKTVLTECIENIKGPKVQISQNEIDHQF